MSASNGSAIPREASEIADKGKGKSVDPTAGHDMMEEDEEDSEEESGVEDVAEPEEEEEDEDNMEEIDTSNIVGSRTRGKNINWAEADKKSKEAGDMDDEDEEDEDDDFEDPEDDKMEE